MCGSKGSNKQILLIFIYVCIVALFGPPYVRKSLVAGSNYAEAIQDDSFSKLACTVRRPIIGIGMVALLGFVVVFLRDYMFRRANSENKIRHTIWLTRISFWVVVATFVSYGTLSILSFFVMEYAGEQSLKEFSRTNFVIEMGITLFAASCLPNEIKWKRYFTKKNITAVLADYYFQEHKKYMDGKDIEKAGAALVKACEAAPSEVVPWAVRAAFTAEFLLSQHDAEIYIGKASENLKKYPAASDEDKAWYEFYLGRILFTQGKVDEAQSHIKHSLAIHHDKNRAAYLEHILKEQITQGEG